MLIHEPLALEDGDQILEMIAKANKNDPQTKQLRVGIYERGHFGSSSSFPGYDEYPLNLPIGAYGVCDDFQQILDHAPEIESSPDRKFIIMLTPIVRANQHPEGGWRWHKWGEYIGTHQPQHEYLYDEVGIDQVFCFHIYEQKEGSKNES